ARLVGDDADDAVPGLGDAEVFVLARFGVVNEDIAAGVVGAVLALLGVALLAADIDLARGADVVARVDLGLGGVALAHELDRRVDVHDHADLVRLRVELEQVGVDAVLGAADVEPAVVAGDDGEVAALLVGVLAGELGGVAEQPGGVGGADGGG